MYVSRQLADLQSTCFFLGPAKSWLDALHTIFLVVDPVTSFLNAVALSATFPDIVSTASLARLSLSLVVRYRGAHRPTAVLESVY